MKGADRHSEARHKSQDERCLILNIDPGPGYASCPVLFAVSALVYFAKLEEFNVFAY